MKVWKNPKEGEMFSFLKKLFKIPKQDMIAFYLRRAGYAPNGNSLEFQDVGEIRGERVQLSFFFDSSQDKGQPRWFVDYFDRLVIKVGDVDLSCFEGPHLDVALEWAKKEAAEVQGKAWQERQAMLAKISK